jgi:hypothetical protein
LVRSQRWLARALAACVAALAAWVGTTVARAQDSTLPAQPARYLTQLSSGLPLRLNLHEDLGQDRVAPAFAQVGLGYLLPAVARYHHGFALSAAMNLSRDGGYAEPVYAGEQLVLTPSYLGSVDVYRDVPLYAHLGLPILVGAGGRSFGLEVGAALGYRLLAGAGLFAQLDLDSFVGSRATLDLIASVSLGVVLEYEVLP